MTASHRVLPKGSPGYPALLAEIFDPPKDLKALGAPIGDAPCLAVVGARRSTAYGREIAHWLARELAASGITVVSGMAHGIDTCAHEGALASGGKTIAVLGSGIDVCYPRRNLGLFNRIREKGTVVSEYPPGTKPMPHHFPARNRIIAGMCLGVVIVEAKLDGGAMITARLALEEGREVFAVPGPVHSENSAGPHSLIRDGARLVASAEDIFDELGLLSLRGPQRSEHGAEGLRPEEAGVLASVGAHPTLVDELAVATGVALPDLIAILSRLEVAGHIRAYAGGRFARAVAR